MKKVLQISIEVNKGSVGRIEEQIGERILNKGWDSYIAYARDCLPTKSKTIKIGTIFDVYSHVLQTRFFDNHGFASSNATKEFVKEIEILQPDIIHIHHLHGYFINIEILFEYLKVSNKPVVWTLHDCWSMTGHCAYFEYVGCEKWKIECNNCPQLAEYPKTLFFDRTKTNYQKKKKIFNSIDRMVIVPVSNWLGDIVKDSFLSKYEIKVIQNGIDINVFYPKKITQEQSEKYNDNNKFIILGVASTWENRKGLQYFIELSKILDNGCQIILVGLSKKQLKELPSNIVGYERTENIDELATLYSIADVFVNPTLEDTFPTTNLEALACGTPIITFKTGGSVESVSESTGFVVEKGNVDALLNAITELRKKTKASYTKACRDRALKLYNKDDKFESYIDLYESMLNPNSGKSIRK